MSARGELYDEYGCATVDPLGTLPEFGRKLDAVRNEALLEAISLARISADAADALGQEREATIAHRIAERIQGLIKEAP